MTKRDIDLEDNMEVGIAVLSGATPQTAFEDYVFMRFLKMCLRC